MTPTNAVPNSPPLGYQGEGCRSGKSPYYSVREKSPNFK